ncbi:GLIPR1-like protein 2 [Ambystoma mexicanum]|uniref:GLIPR1-like protein 2 n=1 Tax=Ambystoma mexicanum TaxID=8296 RepID=UPI0037E737E3
MARRPLLAILLLLRGSLLLDLNPPVHSDSAFIRKMLANHNALRAQVSPEASDMRYMTWDPSLAVTASEWAKKCTLSPNEHLDQVGMAHPRFRKIGENIWVGNAGTELSFTEHFPAEAKYYDYSKKECVDSCRQYTQVVRAETFKVGSAVHFCPSIEHFTFGYYKKIVACNYAPAEDYSTKPYTTRDPCSKCDPDDICVDRLCRNADRDVISYYHGWLPEWTDSHVLRSGIRSNLCSALN